MSTAKKEKSSDGGGGVVSNSFPYGLRVLVIDDDSTCLLVLAKMLQTCHYQVTQCQRAMDALSILRETSSKFDIVISDVHMPDMDGFRLLEIIGLEMDLPVVMMSADDKKDVVMKVIMQGACDYLIKPVRMEAIQFLWQHVVRKQTIGLKSLEQLNNVEHGELHQSRSNDEDQVSLGDKENCGSSNGGKEPEEEEGKDRDDMVSLKKPRMVWTAELHEQFVAAVNQFGLKNAVPKKILELMNVSELTRENVASHLQKYRLYLRRQNESSRHQSKFSSPALHSQEFASSQLPQQSLTILQADVERSNAVFGSGMPLAHQMNLYNYGMVESMPNQSVRDFGNMNEQIGDVQALQTSLRINPLANTNNSIYGNQNSSVLMEKMQNPLHMGGLNEMARDGAFNGGETYHHPLSLPPTIIDFSRAHVNKLSEHDFSLESTPNASFLDNRNQEYTSDLSQEPVLFVQRFDQDDLNIY